MARIGAEHNRLRCLSCKRRLFTPNDKEEIMFTELTEELFELEATTKGYGGALYAAVDPGGGCCGGCCNLVLCCCCSQICW